MAIDELTDEAFFQAYQKNPQVKKIVDDIQRRYHVHFDQKGQPGYDEGNIPIATKEAKETIKRLLAQQKQATAPIGVHSSNTQYTTGLVGILTTIAALSMGAYLIAIAATTITGATLLSQYQTQSYKQKTT